MVDVVAETAITVQNVSGIEVNQGGEFMGVSGPYFASEVFVYVEGRRVLALTLYSKKEENITFNKTEKE